MIEFRLHRYLSHVRYVDIFLFALPRLLRASVEFIRVSEEKDVNVSKINKGESDALIHYNYYIRCVDIFSLAFWRSFCSFFQLYIKYM